MRSHPSLPRTLLSRSVLWGLLALLCSEGLACDYSDLEGDYGKTANLGGSGGGGSGGIGGSKDGAGGSGQSGAAGQGGEAGAQAGTGGTAGAGGDAGQGGAGEGGSAGGGAAGGAGAGGDSGSSGQEGGASGDGGASGGAGQGGEGGGGTGECTGPAECPGQDSECQERTCEAGVCGVVLKAAGLPVGQDIPGDCRKFVCDDQGGVIVEAAPEDLPEDGKECTEDLCEGAEPSHPFKKAGAPCASGGGKVCDGAGACVECVDGATCASGVCQGNSCVAASCNDKVKNGEETDIDCGGACGPCAPGSGCKLTSDCTSQVCVGGKCAAPSCTDKVQNGTETEVDCGGSCPACPRLVVLGTGSAGALGAVRGAAGDWVLTAIPGGASGKPPALAVGAGQVGLGALQGGGNQLLFTTWKGGTWAPFGQVGPAVTTRDVPSVVALGATFGVAFHGEDFKHYYAAFSGSSWSPVEGITSGGNPSFGPAAPVLGVLGGSPMVIFTGDNGDLFDQLRGANAWNAASPHNLGNVAQGVSAVIALPTAGEVLVVFRWKANGSLRSTLRKGGSWGAPVEIPNALSDDPPALVVLPGGGALVAFRGTDKKVYWSTWDGSAWTQAAALVSGAANPAIKSAPSLGRGLLGDAELVFVEDNALGAISHATFIKGSWGAPAVVGGTSLVGAAIARMP